MGDPKGIENLVAAREILRSSLERSRDIALALDKSRPRLEKSRERVGSLASAVQTVATGCAMYEVRGHVDRAVGPAAAVIKVFDLVRELEASVLMADPCGDVFGYLTTVKRLQEAMQLLTDNCRLLDLWLEDLMQFLQGKKCADEWYRWNVKKCLKLCRELQRTDRDGGGTLRAASHKLEKEFRNLLVEISYEPPPLPVTPPLLIQKLQAIVVHLSDNDLTEKCISTYAEVRGCKARAAVEALAEDYLDLSVSGFDSMQSIEGYIDQWVAHMEITVKHFLEFEHGLIQQVFAEAGHDCFAKVAALSGIRDLLSFGNSVTRGKKEAVKLLKLLEIFAALNKLRPDFNRLFTGKACLGIQNATRDLIKNVVDGVCEIFWELPSQVELERSSTPPSNGSIPKMVVFLLDFCNNLLEDEYLSVLVQVLEIRQGWSHELFDKELVLVHLRSIIDTLETNLRSWAESYHDASLSHLFLLNNHSCIWRDMRGTKLGDLMGSAWLSEQESRVEHHATMYLEGSWGKLPALLSEEGLVLFPGGRAIDHNLLKRRLKTFTKAFEDMYKKQNSWVLSDEAVRTWMCQLVMQTVVAPYKGYIEKYVPKFVEYEMETNKYGKYTAAALESMVNSLFRTKVGSCGGGNCAVTTTGLVDKVTRLVTPHRASSTPAAA